MAKNRTKKKKLPMEEELELKIRQKVNIIAKLQKQLDNSRKRTERALDKSDVGRRLASVHSIIRSDAEPQIKINLIESYLE